MFAVTSRKGGGELPLQRQVRQKSGRQPGQQEMGNKASGTGAYDVLFIDHPGAPLTGVTTGLIGASHPSAHMSSLSSVARDNGARSAWALPSPEREEGIIGITRLRASQEMERLRTRWGSFIQEGRSLRDNASGRSVRAAPPGRSVALRSISPLPRSWTRRGSIDDHNPSRRIRR